MQPLVSRSEAWLADGGLLAIVVCALLRFVIWFVVTRHNSLLDAQIITGCLLLCVLNLAGLFLPRTLSAIPQLIGLLGWIFGLSLLPHYLLRVWHMGSRPHWQFWTAIALMLASFIARWVMRRMWSAQIYGKGWAWIDQWAQARSLRARVLARRALITLGYRRVREAAED